MPTVDIPQQWWDRAKEAFDAWKLFKLEEFDRAIALQQSGPTRTRLLQERTAFEATTFASSLKGQIKRAVLLWDMERIQKERQLEKQNTVDQFDADTNTQMTDRSDYLGDI